MSWRLSKTLLVLAAALHWSIVVFNNLVDHPTNLHYVQHVLSMDSVEVANRGSWRAIHNPLVQHGFYWLIIVSEATAMTLLWWGGLRLWRNLRSDGFAAAKEKAVQGLTLVLLLFFSGFTSVGGEWFMMWQAGPWDGTGAAGRLFAMHALILLWLAQSEPDSSV